MSERIGVFVAWPYASGDLHLGHVAGAYLPPDIFARYHRLRGNQVIMVSGSDSHGTPITVQADQEGVPPRDLFLSYHARFLDSFTRLGVSFDLFTHTDTENHHRVSQDIFLKLLENGYLYRERQRQLYSETEGKFLPDRYVIGTCPHCGFEHARGDQCDNCGKVLDALELINPRSRTDASTPVVRETEHYFLDLPRLSPQLEAYLNENTSHWRPNVINFARGWLREGLIGRPITRDLEWGIPVPLRGWEQKRLYVWFEAVIGYLSASIEWARNTGQPDAWRAWWYDPEAPGYYFIGKDNIPFHAIIWPAMLMGAGPLYSDDPDASLNLPYDIPANEYLNLESQKFSKSRHWYINLPDFLDRYDPDPLRYYLTINAPEARDVDFTWAEFVRRNNDELVATWGNLAYRALTFAYRNFDGRVPQPGDPSAGSLARRPGRAGQALDEVDRTVLTRVEESFEPIGELIAACKFQAAIREVMALAQEGNRYLNEKAPWHQIKEDRQAAATTLFVALRVIDSLKVLFSPFLPFSSQELHASLGYQEPLFGTQVVQTFEEETQSHTALTYAGQHDQDRWRPSELPAGQPLDEPRALFKKLDEAMIEEERARLGKPA